MSKDLPPGDPVSSLCLPLKGVSAKRQHIYIFFTLDWPLLTARIRRKELLLQRAEGPLVADPALAWQHPTPSMCHLHLNTCESLPLSR